MTTAQQLYAVADLIADAATAAYRKARQDLIDGKLGADQFNAATRDFNRAMERSTEIVGLGLHHAASELAELTAAVESARDRVREAIDRIEHAADALAILAKILAFAAAIVLAAAAPAAIPGIITAAIALADTVHGVASG